MGEEEKGTMKKKRGAILVMCLIVALAAMALLVGCGNTDRGSDIGMEDLVTPVVAPVDASELPGDFANIKVGMTTDEVKNLVSYPATVQDLEGKRVYKYFINEGQNRLYINFMDEKVESMDLSTP